MANDAPPALVRRLMRAAATSALSTRHAARGGWPYGSLVTVACDHDAAPLLLLSDLSDHAKNLHSDTRAALLFDGTGGHAGQDPLAGPRVSVLGRLAPTGEARLRDRFLARHRAARVYAGFRDFNLYRMHVEAAHLVAGFGKVAWLTRRQLQLRPFDRRAWAAGEGALLARLNGRHTDRVAAAVSRRTEATRTSKTDATRTLKSAPRVEVLSADPEGLDVAVGRRVVRLALPQPVAAPQAMAAALRRLVDAR